MSRAPGGFFYQFYIVLGPIFSSYITGYTRTMQLAIKEVLTAFDVFISLTVPESKYSCNLSSWPARAARKKAVLGSV